jgi:hypothetical protein
MVASGAIYSPSYRWTKGDSDVNFGRNAASDPSRRKGYLLAGKI